MTKRSHISSLAPSVGSVWVFHDHGLCEVVSVNIVYKSMGVVTCTIVLSPIEQSSTTIDMDLNIFKSKANCLCEKHKKEYEIYKGLELIASLPAIK